MSFVGGENGDGDDVAPPTAIARGLCCCYTLVFQVGSRRRTQRRKCFECGVLQIRLEFSAEVRVVASTHRLHAARSTNLCSLFRSDTNRRVIETPIVQNSGSKWMRWIGRGSAMQMYCALMLSGNMIFRADPSANIYEVSVFHSLKVHAKTKTIFCVLLF